MEKLYFNKESLCFEKESQYVNKENQYLNKENQYFDKDRKTGVHFAWFRSICERFSAVPKTP